jgi:Nicotianamine synthase protein
MDRSEAIAFLTQTYRSLAGQKDLSPNNPAVNQGLGTLVATLQRWQAAGFGAELADEPDLAEVAEHLPRLCGVAECEMEKWWCRRILQSVCPGVQALEAFWYLENYRELCRAEYSLVADAKARRFAFLGSGALPMTAILLAQEHPDIEMRCVDTDAEACELSRRLIQWLNLADRVTVHEMRAEDYQPPLDEIVICASLLQAPALFPALEKAGARRLMLRDAEGVYRFCYRPAVLPQRGFVERRRAPLSPKRINTSRYLETAKALSA